MRAGNDGGESVSTIEQEASDWRAEIAARNRWRQLEARERKWTMAVFGLMGYSAFANVLAGVMALASPSDAAIGFVLGALYAVGVYRVWLKDDTRWWPVALPAGLTIAFLAFVALGGSYHPIPVVLNVVLLALVPFRAKAAAKANAAKHATLS